MELSDVKVGETYLYTYSGGGRKDPHDGKHVTVVQIDDPSLGLPWPIEATIDGEDPENYGCFWASELSPVV